ncbi:MAG: hypothetical protein AAGF12_08595 [Myxococcota bacterium]
MPERVTNEELAAALAEAVDEDGNDIQLAEAVARMTPEERRRSDENVRKFIGAARASLRTACDDEPPPKL